MKNYSILFSLLISSVALAQKGIDGMVQSERNFAAYALLNGTKEAFIKYADSTGVIFNNGETINAHTFWSKREKRPGVLNWRPRFAEIANSGDFGYTTGPWTFHPQKITDSIIAAGYFFTVWHLNKKGEWKFLVDIGTSNAPTDSSTTLDKRPILAVTKVNNNDSLVHKIENDFIDAYSKNPQQAYQMYLSDQCILSREQMAYATSAADKATIIASFTHPLKFIPLDAGIASSGDLGYLYGEAVYNGKKQNYLHIWRHERKGWKLALELIQH
jgi:ketosteroid isomerase-like protein